MTFVIDASGSMAGLSIEQAKAALKLALKRLRPRDRINVIAFADEARALFDAPRPADDAGLAAARRFVDRLRAGGGTEMAPALELALGHPAPEGLLQQVVFITNGSVGNEAELFRLIERRLGEARLFTVAIGSAPNSFFIRKAAEVGRGSYSMISDAAEVEERMGTLLAKLERPALTDLALHPPEGSVVYPATVRDLYIGEPVLVHLQLPELGGELRLEGLRDGNPWQQQLDLTSLRQRPGVAQLWGRTRIEHLEDLSFLGTDPEEIRKAVTETALHYRLVSNYTSLVAVDRTPVRPEGTPLDSGQVPQNLPHGQVYEAFVGTRGLSVGYPGAAPVARGHDPADTRSAAGAADEIPRPDRPAMSGRLRLALAATALVTGAALLASGGWVQLKAQLAQRLLARAWDRTLDGNADARP